VNIDIVPIVDAAEASTTIGLTGNNVATYHALSGGAGGLGSATALSNTSAQASNYFAWTITEQALSGIRVTLKNTGNLAWGAAVSVQGAAVSDTAIKQVETSKDGVGGNGAYGALVLGTNAPTYASESGMQAYVTAFTEITSGTTTTTTAAVTAVDTDRTGW